ncbi:MAG: peptidylprolyl isomerase [Acidimicrobiales bacterium]|nr:peptidylprolyl isomerase [Acidimicrobiales bacterium]
MNEFPKNRRKLPSTFIVQALTAALALVVIACGSSIEAVRVGDITLDREGVAALVGEATGGPVDVETIDTETAANVIDRFLRYEALSDLLNEFDVVIDTEARTAARDRLIAAGVDAGNPSLPRFIGWQSALDMVENGGEGIRAAYEANAGLLGHDLCTSHILVTYEDEAHAVLSLLESGEDFAQLAGSISQDPGSAEMGGSLGCVALGRFVPTFERAALGALFWGKTLVGPVPSEFGFHVIRIDEVRNVEPVAFDELDSRLSAALLQIAGLTRTVQVDSRFGSWDPAVGRLAPPSGPLDPALARLGL